MTFVLITILFLYHLVKIYQQIQTWSIEIHAHMFESPCQCKLGKVPVTDTCSRSRYDKFITSKPRVWEYRINCRTFDREPSRLPVKRFYRLLNKSRKTRRIIRQHIAKEFPKSSRIHEWSGKSKKEGNSSYARQTLKTRNFYLSHTYGFLSCKKKSTTSFTNRKKKKRVSNLAAACVRKKTMKQQIPMERTSKSKAFGKSNLFYPSSLLSCKVGHTKRFCPSREMLIRSGDIEVNPGPKEVENIKSPLETLQIRLAENGLRYLDCGGEGDCFFRVVSTKLYRSPYNHMMVRRTGVNFLMNNPERFIESNTDIPWASYLSNMSHQGTWADHLIIQAVADA